ncbi:DUF4278 domain-containing protein [Myxosarcina sp. GI1]|uniref:DUF4278 domain-containing protein n=1 Tax=Myxosarcina sp. GI1 TaxID=1541065 RepID=UPI00056AD6FE|nr:DUF4278 domain-containing protein [Myxosarcina sp. GI1]
MKLTFLGNSYEVNLSPIRITVSNIGGKYRSRFWLRKSHEEQLLPQAYHHLKYRGVRYVSTVYARNSKTSVSVAMETNTSSKYNNLPHLFLKKV